MIANSGEIPAKSGRKYKKFFWVRRNARDWWLKPESAESAGFGKKWSYSLNTPCSTLQVGGGFKRSAHSADPE